MTDVPKSHPRYFSLMTREIIVHGVEIGITSSHGLLAHGRGEAFDYLLGEKTHEFARSAIAAGAALLTLAKKPVISVNGNVAALVPDQLVKLSHALHCPIEVNIFNSSAEREVKIRDYLIEHGARSVLLPSATCILPHIESNRRFINPEGIHIADVIVVPLEDGDRTEALVKNGKKVVTIDLNPSSRTARQATVTVVDNILRALPLLIAAIEKDKQHGVKAESLQSRLDRFDNTGNLERARRTIRETFA